MQWTILGSGRFVITDNYNSTGNLLHTEQVNILVDFGRGNLKALTDCGINVIDIDAICISHVHPDHVADLLAFFQIYQIAFRQKQITKPLTIIGPVGIAAWFEQLENLIYEERPTNITVQEQPVETILIGDVLIAIAPMKHTVPDIAFKFTHQQETIVYTGDTGWNEQLITFAKDAGILVIECTNEIGQQTQHHLNPTEVGQLATAAQVKQVVFTHYGATSRIASITSETAKHYSGIITAAQVCK